MGKNEMHKWVCYRIICVQWYSKCKIFFFNVFKYHILHRQYNYFSCTLIFLLSHKLLSYPLGSTIIYHFFMYVQYSLLLWKYSLAVLHMHYVLFLYYVKSVIIYIYIYIYSEYITLEELHKSDKLVGWYKIMKYSMHDWTLFFQI